MASDTAWGSASTSMTITPIVLRRESGCGDWVQFLTGQQALGRQQRHQRTSSAPPADQRLVGRNIGPGLSQSCIEAEGVRMTAVGPKQPTWESTLANNGSLPCGDELLEGELCTRKESFAGLG